MKTLLVYSNLDGFATNIQRHIGDALSEVEVEWEECYIEDVVKASKDFQPIMHIFFHPNKKIYDYIDGIRELGGHKLLWSMEDPYESDLTFDMLPYFHYIFTTDKNTANALQEETKYENKIWHVPHACDAKVHKPMDVPYEYRSDILFVGNAYKSRLKWFSDHAQEYKDKMVTIIGIGYRGLDGYQHQRVMHQHVTEDEYVKYINGTNLALNLHRQNDDLDMANSRKIQASNLNNRFFEVMACHKKQLVVGRDERLKDLPELHSFRPDHDSYKSRLVQYYLSILK